MKKLFQQFYTLMLVTALFVSSAAKPLPPSDELLSPSISIIFQSPGTLPPPPPLPEPVPIEKD